MSAWFTYYKFGVGNKATTLPESYPDLARMTALAVRAFKRELDHQGFNFGLDLNTYYFGVAMRATTQNFQERATPTLEVDGVIGPKTAKSILLDRVRTVESHHAIPDDLLAKLMQLESNWDPGAIGASDPRDRGLLQINLFWHPSITLESAVDPAYVIPYAGKALAAAYGSFADWDAAIVSWNVGYVAARDWLNAGKPDDDSRPATYIKLIKRQVI